MNVIDGVLERSWLPSPQIQLRLFLYQLIQREGQ